MNLVPTTKDKASALQRITCQYFLSEMHMENKYDIFKNIKSLSLSLCLISCRTRLRSHESNWI